VIDPKIVQSVMLLFCLSGVSQAADDLFTSRIEPILQNHCLKCHNGERHEGELDLTTREGFLKGGDEGPAIVPNKPDDSRLLKKIAGIKPKMPKEGKSLTAAQSAELRTWIEQGAPWPAGLKLIPASLKNRSGPDFWAWQPLKKPAVPAITKNPEWIRNPVDAFITAKRDEKGLTASKEADRRTLIRRLTFNLHGMAPTPEEVEAFVNDADSSAYEKVIDRLLASPRYGERWARHWLDVVHFADTHGYDKDQRRPHAWPYRDYVIRSLNDDKPYSLFIKEQIAGDVLYPGIVDAMVATGFVTAGPWDLVGHTELKDDSTDKKITQLLDRDDMLSNVASTFLSVTAYCARCHDHKFDPIPQKDYYQLNAVFAGIDRGNRPYGEAADLAAQRMRLNTQKKELTQTGNKLNAAMAQRKSPGLKKMEEQLEALNQQLNTLTLPPEAVSPTNGYHSQICQTPDVVKWVQIDLGKPMPFDGIRLLPARPTDFKDSPGFGFPQRFKVEISDDEQFFLAETITDHTKDDFPNPADNPVVVLQSGNAKKSARFVRLTATRLWLRSNDFIFALAEMQVASGDKNIGLGAKVTALDTIEAGRWSTRHLVDGFSSRTKLAEWPALAAAPGESKEAQHNRRRTELQAEIAKIEKERQTLKSALIDPAEKASLEKATVDLAEVEKQLKALPPQRVFYGPLPRKPRPVHLLHRGEVTDPRDEASPGALSIMQNLNADFKLANSSDEGARRAALATWLTDPKNALARRSIVNRIWHYHFGKGIVDTPNDFGYNGGRPTHPELLDWLASEFLENGESLKKLHKLIVSSATYRQASVANAEYEKIDADNRLLWRASRRRLDAESLRDTVLSISGKLDLTMYGPGYDLFNFKDDHSPGYDYAGFSLKEHPQTWRRTIYRFAVRSVPNPFLECLDCADPSSSTAVRNTTNTALQALAVLNDPFIIQHSRHLAARLSTASPEASKQIQMLYALILGRAPAVEEVAAMQEYVSKHGLANACRMLLNTNEFMFVE